MTDASAAQRKATGRGVSYPFIGLEQAIEKARAFHREERQSAAPVSSAMRHFGYGETSSGGRQTIAALLQFGLLQDEGRSENRHVKLTDRALTILLDLPDSPDRLAALRECVRLPKLYANILAKWPQGLPSDHTLGFYLQKEFDFNPKNLKAFISDFRESLAFAKADEESKISSADAEVGEESDVMSASAVVERSESANSAQKAALAAITGHAPAVLVSSEREWLRGPLSRDVGYRLIVSGDMGAKELGKLIKLLEAQKSVLDDDADDQA